MSEFSHLKNKLLAEQVEDEIYHYILDTPLEPGAKLPNEFELGEKFVEGNIVKLANNRNSRQIREILAGFELCNSQPGRFGQLLLRLVVVQAP